MNVVENSCKVVMRDLYDNFGIDISCASEHLRDINIIGRSLQCHNHDLNTTANYGIRQN
jgi:hypothetical protein